jgi:beta-mannanase
MLVRFAHEMNGTWYPWGALKDDNRPADYIAAWRRVVRIFRAEGARNVRWVWSPNIEYGLPPARRYFPGDRWVDWVALDGFNWGRSLPSGWRTMRETFEASYRNMVRLSRKPIMIAETGTAQSGGNRARWITSGFMRDIPRYMPRIRAIVWFNWRAQLDWRIETSGSALRAYRRVAASRGYYRPRRR